MPLSHVGLDPYEAPWFDVAERSWIYGRGLAAVARCARVSPKRYLYYFASEVRWHDGKIVTASDVNACYERLLASHPAWKNTFPYDRVARVAVESPGLLSVELHEPSKDFARTFFQAYGALPVPLIRAPGDRLLGTAPFRLASQSADAWRFDRIRGAGTLGVVTLRNYADPDSAFVALRSGEIDALVDASHTTVPSNGIRLVERNSGVVYLIANTQGSLRDETSRSSILNAIDTGSIARLSYGHPRTEELLPGVRLMLRTRKPAHVSRELTIAFAHAPAPERSAILIEQQLQRHGIATQLRGWPILAYDAALREGNYDLAIVGDDFAVLDDLAPSVRCDERAPLGRNYTRLCDPALDRALARGDASSASTRLSEDAVIEVLSAYDDRALLNPRVHMPLPRAPFVPWFADLERWTIS